MPFEIVRNDITNMQVDAIVNTANPRPVIGSGTDAAIHAKAGPMLLLTRKCIGNIDTGAARITPGFRLPAKYVIHTVGPVWKDGGHGEAVLLRRCYENSLSLARRKGLKSIAFPLISTGNYGFPSELALEVACDAIRSFLEKHEMQIYLVVFNRESYRLSAKLQKDIRSFIDEQYAREQAAREYSFRVRSEYEPVQAIWEAPIYDDAVYDAAPEEPCLPSAPAPVEVRKARPQRQRTRKKEVKAAEPLSLEQMLKAQDAGFSETLLQLIAQTGKKDPEIYRRANVSRQHFSKIRSNPHYQPKKPTALAFAIALELDLEQTKDLIGRAGYALTSSSKADLIIMYFIQKKHYNIIDINAVLFEFDQSLLGA